MTVIHLPLPPTGNNLFATGRHGGRFRSSRYKAWITEAGWEITRQRPLKHEGRVSLLIEVREPPPKPKRKEDLDNRAKATIDLLVSHRVIEDDSHPYVRQITLGWSTEVAGIRITVKPWTE